MVLKPVPMGRIAVIGLRNEKQTVISILHDLNVVQLEPLSKDVATLVRNERDNEMFRQVSDQLLRMKALKTVLPPIEATQCQRFTSMDQIMQATKSINIDDKVATLEKEKEHLLTQLKETENNIKLVEEFSFFPEDFSVLQLKMAHSYFGRVDSKNYAAFKKALDVNSQDVFIYPKEGKDTTNLVLVTFPNFPPHALATVVQEYDVKLEAVPKLDGKADQLIQNLKAKHTDISNKLKEV
ncbi:MAG: V-type ATPase 116kDa subunit family protein, partial [Nitrosotalea sp.]